MRSTEPKYGPKMLALGSDRQRRFVECLLNRSDRNPTRAAADAGYSTVSDGSLYVQAHRLWHDERIQEAIHEEAQRRIKGLVPLAVQVITDVMENVQATGAERIKAAQIILDRGGFHGVTEHKSIVQHIGDDADQMKRIASMAAALGIPVEQLLGRRLSERAPVIDVTPIEPEPILIEDKWKDLEY